MFPINETVTAFWPVITGIAALFVAIIVFWVNSKRDVVATNLRIDNIEKRLDKENTEFDKRLNALEGKVENIEPVLNQIQTDIALVRQSQQYIENQFKGLSK